MLVASVEGGAFVAGMGGPCRDCSPSNHRLGAGSGGWIVANVTSASVRIGEPGDAVHEQIMKCLLHNTRNTSQSSGPSLQRATARCWSSDSGSTTTCGSTSGEILPRNRPIRACASSADTGASARLYTETCAAPSSPERVSSYVPSLQVADQPSGTSIVNTPSTSSIGIRAECRNPPGVSSTPIGGSGAVGTRARRRDRPPRRRFLRWSPAAGCRDSTGAPIVADTTHATTPSDGLRAADGREQEHRRTRGCELATGCHSRRGYGSASMPSSSYGTDHRSPAMVRPPSGRLVAPRLAFDGDADLRCEGLQRRAIEVSVPTPRGGESPRCSESWTCIAPRRTNV